MGTHHRGAIVCPHNHYTITDDITHHPIPANGQSWPCSAEALKMTVTCRRAGSACNPQLRCNATHDRALAKRSAGLVIECLPSRQEQHETTATGGSSKLGAGLVPPVGISTSTRFIRPCQKVRARLHFGPSSSWSSSFPGGASTHAVVT